MTTGQDNRVNNLVKIGVIGGFVYAIMNKKGLIVSGIFALVGGIALGMAGKTIFEK